MKTIAELTAARDRAYRAWSDVSYRVREVQNSGPVDILPILEGQARFLWAEYESLAGKVAARRILDIVEEGAR